MALAGLLAVALTATADRGNAGGIDGLRAVVPGPSAASGLVASPPVVPKVSATPVSNATPGSTDPGTVIVDPAAVPTASTPPASTPTASTPTPTSPTTTPVPTAAPPAPTPAATPFRPAVTPSPSASPSPVITPAPTPTSVPTPAPGLVALVTDRGAIALVSLGDIVPGDVITRTMAVRNTGTSAFRYTVSVTQTAGTPLWTDPVDGLQLTLRSPGGTALYSGPLSGLGTVAAPNVVAAGASDDLVYVFALPATASNAFQGLAQDLTIVLTAVQYP